MSCFLLQKKPDGQSSWDDREGSVYSFAQRLPNAAALCRNDIVIFYRPKKSGTPEDVCIYTIATVSNVVVGDRRAVEATLRDFEWFPAPVPLDQVGDPRANSQHSFQPVDRSFLARVLELAK